MNKTIRISNEMKVQLKIAKGVVKRSTYVTEKPFGMTNVESCR